MRYAKWKELVDLIGEVHKGMLAGITEQSWVYSNECYLEGGFIRLIKGGSAGESFQPEEIVKGLEAMSIALVGVATTCFSKDTAATIELFRTTTALQSHAWVGCHVGCCQCCKLSSAQVEGELLFCLILS